MSLPITRVAEILRDPQGAETLELLEPMFLRASNVPLDELIARHEELAERRLIVGALHGVEVFGDPSCIRNPRFAFLKLFHEFDELRRRNDADDDDWKSIANRMRDLPANETPMLTCYRDMYALLACMRMAPRVQPLLVKEKLLVDTWNAAEELKNPQRNNVRGEVHYCKSLLRLRQGATSDAHRLWTEASVWFANAFEAQQEKDRNGIGSRVLAKKLLRMRHEFTKHFESLREDDSGVHHGTVDEIYAIFPELAPEVAV